MKKLKTIYLQVSKHYGVWHQGNHFNLISKDALRDFKASLSKIVDEVCSKRDYLDVPKIKDDLIRIAQYNIEDGKNASSTIMLHAYNCLESSKKMNLVEMHPAFVLAWSLEMLQSHKLILKNVDKKTERGYISNIELNKEANLLRSFMYEVLDNNFMASTLKSLFQMYNKGFLYTAIGEYYNNNFKTKSHKYSDFNLQRYNLICEYITAYNNFQLPLFLAMQLKMIEENALYSHVGKICFDLGKLYQMKEDYHDCFGEESRINRSSGSNIQDGKCTWLAVMALQRCTAAQRVVFNACYGSNEPAHVERVKLLYEQIKIPQLYWEQENALCERITQKAETNENKGIPSVLFFKLLDSICMKENK